MQVHANSIQTEQVRQQNQAKAGNMIVPSAARSFSEVLNDKIAESRPLQFSKHASLRLGARDLTLSNEQLKRVENGISKAREKGINDSLVLVDSIALVVNVRNKVVVTAMSGESDNVFTNIDGAVIV